MASKFRVIRLLRGRDRAAFDRYLIADGCTIDDASEWLAARGIRISRSAICNYRIAYLRPHPAPARPVKDADQRRRLVKIAFQLNGENLSTLVAFAGFLLAEKGSQ
jgi:hypothetical protein